MNFHQETRSFIWLGCKTRRSIFVSNYYNIYIRQGGGRISLIFSRDENIRRGRKLSWTFLGETEYQGYMTITASDIWFIRPTQRKIIRINNSLHVFFHVCLLRFQWYDISNDKMILLQTARYLVSSMDCYSIAVHVPSYSVIWRKYRDIWHLPYIPWYLLWRMADNFLYQCRQLFCITARSKSHISKL